MSVGRGPLRGAPMGYRAALSEAVSAILISRKKIKQRFLNLKTNKSKRTMAAGGGKGNLGGFSLLLDWWARETPGASWTAVGPPIWREV